MYIPKRYGESKKQNCPFCDKPATTTSDEGVPVCRIHKNESVGLLRCLCGESLDIRAGKWGPYGVCMRCGNISWAKVLSCNTIRPRSTAPQTDSSSNSSGPSSNPAIPKQRQQQFRKTYKTESEKKTSAGNKEIVMTSDEVDFYFG